MKILILDPRSGDQCADLYLVDAHRGATEQVRLGYVPEIYYDSSARELVVLETQLKEDNNGVVRHWLKSFALNPFRLSRQQQIPERPMYAGLSGRSTRLACDPNGRYLYFFASQGVIRYPQDEDVFRLTVQRYDRRREVVEPGVLTLESCMLDFGHLGTPDEGLYFHLSCDYPSTLAFGRFGSAELEWVQLEVTPPRSHLPQETCGSWQAPDRRIVYCVTGEGKIYEVRRPPEPSRLLLRLPLSGSRCVPLHHLTGTQERLFVGVSVTAEERSLCLASEIWQIDRATATVRHVTHLPIPIFTFVTSPDGALLAAVNPYKRVLFVLETASDRVVAGRQELGISPAELLLLP